MNHLLVQIENGVQSVRDLPLQANPVDRHANGKVPSFEGDQRLQQDVIILVLGRTWTVLCSLGCFHTHSWGFLGREGVSSRTDKNVRSGCPNSVSGIFENYGYCWPIGALASPCDCLDLAILETTSDTAFQRSRGPLIVYSRPLKNLTVREIASFHGVATGS